MKDELLHRIARRVEHAWNECLPNIEVDWLVLATERTRSLRLVFSLDAVVIRVELPEPTLRAAKDPVAAVWSAYERELASRVN